ncbi:MAG: PAS domain S-box protein [Sphingomicrobium sp.]
MPHDDIGPDDALDAAASSHAGETSVTGEALFQFLDRLGQQVSKAVNADEIMALTTKLTAEHLALSNCAYADMDEDEDGFTIRGNWHAPGSPSIVGHYSLADFGSLAVKELTARRPLIINDNRKELEAHEAKTFQDIGIAATICMPLVKGGRLRALMAIHDQAPHYWSNYELEVIREVTERSWAHVERVRAEAELRASNERFRAAVRATHGVLWTNDSDGCMTGEQPGWAGLTGQSFEEYQGHGWAKAIHPEDAPATIEAWTRAVEQRETFVFEHRVRRLDGEWRLCLIRAVPVTDATGNVVEWVGVHTDITEERTADQALRGSEAQLRLVLDASPGGFYAVDREGNTTLASRGFLTMMGFSDESEAVGRKLHGVIHHSHPDGSPYLVEDCPLYRCASTGEASHVEDELFFRIDGHPVPVEYWATPIIQDGEHIGASCTIVELTERKAAESALREGSRTLETLNRTGAALAAELDFEKLVQMVTDAGVELTGAHFGAFFYNVLNDEGGSYMLYALSGADPSQFDFGMPRATAVFQPTFAGEGVIRSSNITEDPRYGLSEPHFGMPKGHLPVVSHLAIPVISRTGEVLGGLFFGHPEVGRFTERHERLMVGIAAQAAVGIDNARLYQAAQKELADRMLAEAALREFNETLEARVKQEVDRRSEVEEALRQSQKMETVGQLTGGIAHDFNNLLQIVNGNLDILRNKIPEESTQLRRYAERAMVGAERAATLTQRLLAFSRRQPLAPKPIDVNKLVAGMSELLHRTLGETIEVEAVLAPRLWPVEADPNQLENTIINLAINARDAMAEGGKLTIETQNTHLDEGYAAKHPEVSRGQYVVMCITDTGIGMDADTIDRAIEPFYTTKEVGRGTGLGLSMVYGFVKQTGGHLKIYSEPGEGTTVKIYLPRLVGEVPVDVERFSPPVAEATGKETILVCEDDDDVRAYSVEVLSELGYRVLEAADGPSALRLLKEQSDTVDLLFTDVVLPGGMTGAVLAKEAAAIRPGLKTLFTTGYARNAIVHQGRLDRGVELLTKPFSYADLAVRVRDILDKDSSSRR